MSEAKIKLDGVVNIARVEGLHHEMEDILKQAVPTTIEAMDVSRVDTAALQLIAVFIKDMGSAGAGITWNGVSDEFLAAAKLVGLEKVLNLPLVS